MREPIFPAEPIKATFITDLLKIVGRGTCLGLFQAMLDSNAGRRKARAAPDMGAGTCSPAKETERSRLGVSLMFVPPGRPAKNPETADEQQQRRWHGQSRERHVVQIHLPARSGKPDTDALSDH